MVKHILKILQPLLQDFQNVLFYDIVLKGKTYITVSVIES